MPIQTECAPEKAGSNALAPGAVEEAARRQTIFREVNENIARLAIARAQAGYALVICECSVSGCADSLEITPAEYEDVRRVPTRFVVVPGHQMPAIERVVDGNSRFLVVEKLGHAAEIAAADGGRQA